MMITQSSRPNTDTGRLPVCPIGPKLTKKQSKILAKILDFSSQVWINCEHQINMYEDPCGDIFAAIGERMRKMMHHESFDYPCSFFYTLGVEFGNYTKHMIFGHIASILTIFFINWANFLETQFQQTVNSHAFLTGLDFSLNRIEEFSNNSPLLRSLLSGHEEFKNIESDNDILKIFEAATLSAEKNVTENTVNGRKVAESHVVGITFRAIFQAFRATL